MSVLEQLNFSRRQRLPLVLASEAAECGLGVEIRSAGGVEAAADLGEGQRDQHRRDADEDDQDRAPAADERGE